MLFMKKEEKKLSKKDKVMIGGLAVLSATTIGLGVACANTNHKLNLSRLEIENLKVETVKIKERLDKVDAVLIETNMLYAVLDHFTRVKSMWATKVNNRKTSVELGEVLGAAGAGLLEVAEDRYDDACKRVEDTKELIELFK